MRSPLSAEGELRKLLRAECGSLSAVTLENALQLASNFYESVRDFATDGDDGDGFVVYKDVTNHGKGTRLEVGMVRAYCLREDIASTIRRSAMRLRLRCCYRFDHEIVSEVLSEPTWSLYCWNPTDLAAVLSATRAKAAFRVLSTRKPAEVNVSTEQASYLASAKNPRPDAKQMWWTVADVD
jgi:hypothetical protein